MRFETLSACWMVAIVFVASVGGIPFYFRVNGLLQRNMLARILERPGAKAVPGSVGEAISTLRDDVGGGAGRR